MTTGIIAASLSLVAGLFTGGVAGLGLLGTSAFAAAETAQKTTDLEYEKNNITNQYQDATMAPHTIMPTISSRQIASLNELYAPSFALQTVTDFVQQTIANYFMKNGYN